MSGLKNTLRIYRLFGGNQKEAPISDGDKVVFKDPKSQKDINRLFVVTKIIPGKSVQLKDFYTGKKLSTVTALKKIRKADPDDEERARQKPAAETFGTDTYVIVKPEALDLFKAADLNNSNDQKPHADRTYSIIHYSTNSVTIRDSKTGDRFHGKNVKTFHLNCVSLEDMRRYIETGNWKEDTKPDETKPIASQS